MRAKEPAAASFKTHRFSGFLAEEIPGRREHRQYLFSKRSRPPSPASAPAHAISGNDKNHLTLTELGFKNRQQLVVSQVSVKYVCVAIPSRKSRLRQQFTQARLVEVALDPGSKVRTMTMMSARRPRGLFPVRLKERSTKRPFRTKKERAVGFPHTT